MSVAVAVAAPTRVIVELLNEPLRSEPEIEEPIRGIGCEIKE